MRFNLIILALVIVNGMLVFGQEHPAVQGKSIMVISTSEAIDLARQVARDDGIDVEDRRHVTLDLLTMEDGKPVFPGYMTLGIQRNLEVLSQVSINEKTGQLVDTFNCRIYEYPDILHLQKEYTKATGVQPLTISELSSEVGCKTLKELRVPTPVPKKKK